ncbi:uncharacterized protein LOC123202449 isoform X2 [Mangifera indica]|uniref:uncharacterized protein LOC123202449 isoform X2 n=1 Tax=Mangifera indica TaxID=29780 RepID=UPI001CFA15B4|nr:uncharacterized protein LOC123202449 isoform X2 [Mangifera indica]
MDPTPTTRSVAPNEPLSTDLQVSATTKPLDKRAAENAESQELVAMKSPKKARIGAEKEAKRVAEIVLVLSAMWRMRGGGKGPTEAELRLMAEAREKLVEMCEDLAPRDIVARDAIVGLIEDLGLNGRIKEQRLGFRGQRLSIKEKLEITKKKIEDSKKFSAQPTTYASQPHTSQTGFGATADSRGVSNTVRIFSSDKSGLSPAMHSGGFPASSPHVHVSAGTSTHLHLPTSDVRTPTISTGSHLGRDSSSSAMPRIERPQIRLDGGSNGSSYVSQVQANTSSNHMVNAPTWTVHPQSASSAKPGPENKVQNLYPIRIDGTADLSRTAPQAARDQTFRPFMTQTASGNLPSIHQPPQAVNTVQAQQSSNGHSEIAKIVQKLLHPKLPEHPTWTPPSREYMNKALTCQMCKLTVNEVETIVLCDACEKGFHLKCLQLNNQKGIPRGGEWHCLNCLKLSNGKPLPPKYGRVMRSINAPKMPSNTSVFQSSPEKKVGSTDLKVNQQKLMRNGSSTGSGSIGSNTVELAPSSKIQNTSTTQGSNFLSGAKGTDQETSSGTCPNNTTKSSGAILNPPSVESSEQLTQPTQVCESSTQLEKLPSASKSKFPDILSEPTDYHSYYLQPAHDSQVIRTDLPSCAEVSFENFHDGNSMVKQDGKDIAQRNPLDSSGVSSDLLHNVEWIGDVLQTVDEKKFYEYCTIGGIMYKVQDHALLQFNHGKTMPSKLQAMWEDTRNGSKWVKVHRCFFPGDLPEAVGRPCAPESSELYDSNSENTMMAGLIEGPCEVLTSRKFKEENERLSHLGIEADNGRQPIFLCKWFYDEVKGVFRPVSD